MYVWSSGHLHPFPDGVVLMAPTKMLPLMKSGLLSWRGKARASIELLIPPKQNRDDESLAQFVRRRLGSEMLDKIAEPMIAGIYVADAEKLSLASTFPRFTEMEDRYGSVWRGLRAQRRAEATQNGSGKKLPVFMSLRGGMQELSDALAARLEPSAVLKGRRAVDVTRNKDEYVARLADGERVTADAVVFATPANVTAQMVRDFDPLLAAKLIEIRYVSSATISLGYKRADVPHPLNGAGMLVPRSEKRALLACTWTSSKFRHRAPADHVLLRAFVGGARNEDIVEDDDNALVNIVRSELREMLGITAAPDLAYVYRWRKGNPQYEVGHRARVAAIEQSAARHTGLYLVGSAYHGVGIPDCIHGGARVAERILGEIGSISRDEVEAREYA